jgi:hypothetical protein
MKVGDLIRWTATNPDGTVLWQRLVLFLGQSTIASGNGKRYSKISFDGGILSVSEEMLSPL